MVCTQWVGKAGSEMAGWAVAAGLIGVFLSGVGAMAFYAACQTVSLLLSAIEGA